jgi:hypothetical protein
MDNNMGIPSRATIKAHPTSLLSPRPYRITIEVYAFLDELLTPNFEGFTSEDCAKV